MTPREIPAVDPRLVELLRIVREHFGPELTSVVGLVVGTRVRGILYDAVVFSCGFDDPTGAFGAVIHLANGEAVTSVFGERIARDRAPDEIARSLDLIHEYARLSLPPAYLERFTAGTASADPVATA